MRRREFLRHSAVISVPFLAAGCGLSLPVVRPQREAPAENPWLKHFDVDSRGLSQVLDALGSKGGDFGEAYFQDRQSFALRRNAGAILSRSEDRSAGAGLRVVRGGQSGFRHTRALDVANLQQTAAAAAGDLGAGQPIGGAQPNFSFLEPGNAYPRQAPDDDLGQSEALVARLDALIRGAEPTISEVDINLTVVDEWVLIATLDGRLVADRRPLLRLSAQAFLTRGSETQSGFAALSLRQTLSQLDEDGSGGDRIEALARTVVERTRSLFDSRRPPEGDMPVVLSAGTAGVLLHEAVAHAFEADFVREGRSPFGARDEIVAAEAVTLVDDATQRYQRGALNVDDEGEAGRRTVLIDGGRLSSLLYDKQEALAAGVAPTGNGRRASYAFEPLPRASCTYIENGSESPEALLASMDRGIVADTFVGGEVDPGGGRFRFRVKHGWVVEGGRRRVPVRDFELSGDGLQLLKDIRLVANDRQFDPAGWSCRKKGQAVPVSQGMPSVLVSSLGVRPLS